MKRKLGLTAVTAAMAAMAFAGTASAAEVTTSTDTLNFGDQTVGTTSAAKPVTLNVPCLYVLDLGQYGGKRCTAPGKIDAVNMSGGDFDQTNDCVLPISNSSTSGEVVHCTIFVSFHPAETGARQGVLSFTSYASTEAYPVLLNGNGTAVPVQQGGGDKDAQGGKDKGTQGAGGTAGAVAKKCKKVKKGAAKAKKCKAKKRR